MKKLSVVMGALVIAAVMAGCAANKEVKETKVVTEQPVCAETQQVQPKQGITSTNTGKPEVNIPPKQERKRKPMKRWFKRKADRPKCAEPVCPAKQGAPEQKQPVELKK